jgi:NAD(P)-dependent dehydrogenase (short-subunit alcohol dehydrogenase family)
MDHPVILITGALTGVGRATALAFAREGARLVVSGRRDSAGQALVAELRALGAEAEYVHADVRHETDVSRLVDQVVERFGRLDSAVNNGGKVGIAGASVYVASKHAIEGLTKSAALEGAAAGVRVNAVAPGPVATEMLAVIRTVSTR